MKAPRPHRAGREVAAALGPGKENKEGKGRSRRRRKQEARKGRGKEKKVFPSRYPNSTLDTPHQTDNERTTSLYDVLP